MQSFSIRTMRALSILLGICFVFALLVYQAYDYLPKDEVPLLEIKQEQAIEKDSSNLEDDAESEEEPNLDEEVIKTEQEQPLLEVVSEEEILSNEKKGSEINEINTYEVILDKARELKSKGDFSNSLNAYMSALEQASNDESKAICYEEVAIIYGSLKKYGSALSAAQKAFNLAPNSNREMLLARIYYKLGEIEKAKTRINNILYRDFELDK